MSKYWIHAIILILIGYAVGIMWPAPGMALKAKF